MGCGCGRSGRTNAEQPSRLTTLLDTTLTSSTETQAPQMVHEQPGIPPKYDCENTHQFDNVVFIAADKTYAIVDGKVSVGSIKDEKLSMEGAINNVPIFSMSAQAENGLGYSTCGSAIRSPDGMNLLRHTIQYQGR